MVFLFCRLLLLALFSTVCLKEMGVTLNASLVNERGDDDSKSYSAVAFCFTAFNAAAMSIAEEGGGVGDGDSSLADKGGGVGEAAI